MRVLDRVNALRRRLGLRPVRSMNGRSTLQLVRDLEAMFPPSDFEMIVNSRNPAKTFRKWLTWQGV